MRFSCEDTWAVPSRIGKRMKRSIQGKNQRGTARTHQPSSAVEMDEEKVSPKPPEDEAAAGVSLRATDVVEEEPANRCGSPATTTIKPFSVKDT